MPQEFLNTRKLEQRVENLKGAKNFYGGFFFSRVPLLDFHKMFYNSADIYMMMINENLVT